MEDWQRAGTSHRFQYRWKSVGARGNEAIRSSKCLVALSAIGMSDPLSTVWNNIFDASRVRDKKTNRDIRPQARAIVMDTEHLPTVSAPMPWHAAAWTLLHQQMEQGQTPHALLLVGPEYSGKSRLAIALARLMLCSQPVAGLNCGNCHACELFAAGSHGDFRWLEPEEKSRVIKIEQIRQLVEFTNRTAGFGQRKLVVLAPAESMNTNAANALLKSLEEPATDTYLILVCHRLQGLPATIRSRCQILRLALPAREEALQWLDQITSARTQSALLLDLAQGRPMLAEQLRSADGVEHLEAVHRALRQLFTGTINVPGLVQLLADESLEKVLARMVAELQAILRELSAEQLTTPQARVAFRLLDQLLGAQAAVAAGSNPNRQLFMEALLAKVQRELGEAWLGDNIRAQKEGVYS